MSKPLVVAIDGEACSGKGSVARLVAEDLGFGHLDSGILYRAVTFGILFAEEDPSDTQAALETAKNLDENFFNLDRSLYSEEVNKHVSVVAAMPEVRKELFRYQREFPKPPGAVIDGRDIGTSIFPDASVKFYLTARPEIRAMRAINRLREKGEKGNFDEIYGNILERDRRDRESEHSPMKAAPDAIKVDTSDLGLEQVHMLVLGICAKNFASIAYRSTLYL